MSQPDFSIVTPSFNQAQFISNTLESVQNQKNITLQHIVVDPGSSDNSKQIIRTFSAIDFIEKKDHCQSEGINNGFKECRGRFMAWLNSDDIYPSDDILSHVKNAFDNNPEVDIVYGNAIFIDEDGKFLRNYFVNKNAASLARSFEYQVGICQPAVFWRSDVYKKIGALDESLEFQLDYEYWIRMSQADLKWLHLDQTLAAHRWWSGMKTSSQRDLSLSESLKLVKKKFGYVHNKWAERLAAYECSGSDGIINVNQSGNSDVEQATLQILKAFNTNTLTLKLLQSAEANEEMQKTFAVMQAGGVAKQSFFTAIKQWISLK